MKLRIVKVEGHKLTYEIITTETKTIIPRMEHFNVPELVSQISKQALGKRDILGNNHPFFEKRYILKYPFTLKQTEGLWVIMDYKM